MKKLVLLSAAALTFSTGVLAQQKSVKQRILRNVDVIKDEIHYTSASRQDLREALKLVRQAKRIILGRSSGPAPGPGPRPPSYPSRNYTCVDRDNDNRAPYVFSYVDGNFNVIKERKFRFNSMAGCQQSLRDKFYVQNTEMFCIARDGDGRKPYVSVMETGDGFKVLTGQLFYSYNACQNAFTSKGRNFGDEYLFCIDRDNDNRKPYVLKSFNARTGQFTRKSNGTFGSMSSCEQILYSR